MTGVVFHYEAHSSDVYSGRAIDLAAWTYCMKIPGDIERAVIVDHATRTQFTGLDRAFIWTITDEIPKLDGHITAVGEDVPVEAVGVVSQLHGPAFVGDAIELRHTGEAGIKKDISSIG